MWLPSIPEIPIDFQCNLVFWRATEEEARRQETARGEKCGQKKLLTLWCINYIWSCKTDLTNGCGINIKINDFYALGAFPYPEIFYCLLPRWNRNGVTPEVNPEQMLLTLSNHQTYILMAVSFWQIPEARQKRGGLSWILRINTKECQTKNNVCSVSEYKEGWMETVSSGGHCTHFQLRLKITMCWNENSSMQNDWKPVHTPTEL